MPKVLNVEHLENKFACLTRARESITNLSSWILRHSEFSEGIGEEWLTGLTKDFSALNMFYVANDVIMQCGKKKVPQYRVEFAKVLGDAMCLSNVKEIDKEIRRIVKIWKDRSIFEDHFCDILIKKLESPVEEAKEPVPEESELDIISNYKKETLFDSLIKLKYLMSEVEENEEILKYAEEPDKPDYEILGKRGCQNMRQKVTRYCSTISNFIRLVESEVELRTKILKDLDNTNIFYTSQQEDVKKVAHAYKIYGKKINKVAKHLAEKREILSTSKTETEFSDNDVSSPKSPDDTFSFSEELSNASESPSSSPSDSVKIPSHLPEKHEIKDISDASLTKHSRSIDQNSKIYQIFNEGNQKSEKKETTPKSSENEKSGSYDSIKELSEIVEDTSTTDSSVKTSSYTPDSSTPNVNIVKKEDDVVRENVFENISIERVGVEKEKVEDKENMDWKKDLNESFTKNLVDQVNIAGEEDKTIKTDDDDSLDDPDQMLEKSYKRESMKRKIKLLLQTKSKKFCPSPTQIDSLNQNLSESPSQEKSGGKQIHLDNKKPVIKEVSINDMQYKGELMSVNNKESCTKEVFTDSEKTTVADGLKKSEKKTRSPQIKMENMSSLDQRIFNMAGSLNFRFGDVETKASEDEETTDQSQDAQAMEIVNQPIKVGHQPMKTDDQPMKVVEQPMKVCHLPMKLDDQPIKVGPQTMKVDDQTMKVDDQTMKVDDQPMKVDDQPMKVDDLVKKKPCDFVDENQTPIDNKAASGDLNNDLIEHKNQTSNLFAESQETDEQPFLECGNEDSFFSSICSSSIPGTNNSIPGLEINEKLEIKSPNRSENKEIAQTMKTPDVTMVDEDNTKLEVAESSESVSNDSLEVCNSTRDNYSLVNNDKSVTSLDSSSQEVESKVVTDDNVSSATDTEIACDNNNCISTNCEKERSGFLSTDQSKIVEIESKKIVNTVCSIFECLSKNKSECSQKSDRDEWRNFNSGLSLENCLKLYRVLQIKKSTIPSVNNNICQENYINYSSQSMDMGSQNVYKDSCTTTNAVHGPISSTFGSNNIPLMDSMVKDNFEVADMECDSE